MKKTSTIGTVTQIYFAPTKKGFYFVKVNGKQNGNKLMKNDIPDTRIKFLITFLSLKVHLNLLLHMIHSSLNLLRKSWLAFENVREHASDVRTKFGKTSKDFGYRKKRRHVFRTFYILVSY